MIWITIGVIILLLNVMFIVIDLRNDFIRKGTLLNAFAAGVILMSILNAVNAL
jgi:hypothetical protein